jgi:hypothetical protein
MFRAHRSTYREEFVMAGASFHQDPGQMTTPPAARAVRDTGRSGWITFAGAYLLIAGGLHMIWGIVALSNRDEFRESSLVWSNLNTWGWIAIVVGGVQVIGAFMVFAQRFAGQWLAGVLAILGIFVAFLSLGAYPIWSVVVMVCNGLVLWAVTAHGEEFGD